MKIIITDDNDQEFYTLKFGDNVIVEDLENINLFDRIKHLIEGRLIEYTISLEGEDDG